MCYRPSRELSMQLSRSLWNHQNTYEHHVYIPSSQLNDNRTPLSHFLTTLHQLTSNERSYCSILQLNAAQRVQQYCFVSWIFKRVISTLVGHSIESALGKRYSIGYRSNAFGSTRLGVNLVAWISWTLTIVLGGCTVRLLLFSRHAAFRARRSLLACRSIPLNASRWLTRLGLPYAGRKEYLANPMHPCPPSTACLC